MEAEGYEKIGYYFIKTGTSFESKNLLEIRELIEEANKKNISNIVFDLSECTYIDSSGIGLLVAQQKKCTAKNGIMCLLAVHKKILDIFSVSNVDVFFKMYKTLEDLPKVK